METTPTPNTRSTGSTLQNPDYSYVGQPSMHWFSWLQIKAVININYFFIKDLEISVENF